jgi:hypothetical protein
MAKKADELVLTEELLRIASGQFDVTIITATILTDLGLRSLGNGFEKCTSLVTLDLSRNKLTSIDGLLFLSGTLQHLDLSSNSIANVTLLAQFKSLEVLKLQENAIDLFDALGNMSSGTMPALRSIYLQTKDGQMANRICADKEAYSKGMNERFAKIRSLDGHYFLKEQANPNFVDVGNDQEVKLPPSVPWVTEESLKGIVADPTKAGLITEKAFYTMASESRKIAAAARR